MVCVMYKSTFGYLDTRPGCEIAVQGMCLAELLRSCCSLLWSQAERHARSVYHPGATAVGAAFAHK